MKSMKFTILYNIDFPTYVMMNFPVFIGNRKDPINQSGNTGLEAPCRLVRRRTAMFPLAGEEAIGYFLSFPIIVARQNIRIRS